MVFSSSFSLLSRGGTCTSGGARYIGRDFSHFQRDETNRSAASHFFSSTEFLFLSSPLFGFCGFFFFFSIVSRATRHRWNSFLSKLILNFHSRYRVFFPFFFYFVVTFNRERIKFFNFFVSSFSTSYSAGWMIDIIRGTDVTRSKGNLNASQLENRIFLFKHF